MEKVYSSVEELIGNTPIIKLTRLSEKKYINGTVYAKLEAKNPGGSAKDRVALSMLRAAMERGEVTKDTVIIEPTSGNTGIGLAMLGAAWGLKTIIVMPDSMSRERQLLMSAYGAELVLTPGKEGMRGAIARAEELKREYPSSFIPSQFENPDNKAAHFATTGPEIYEALGGELDAFIAGVGTGGTISGVGEYLKAENEKIDIVGIEPAKSAVLSGEAPGAHGLQGIGAGFIPEVLNQDILDRVIKITEDEAYEAARELATSEGILAGISGGAALAGAFKYLAEDTNRGKAVVVLLPDTGERYLSSGLYG